MARAQIPNLEERALQFLRENIINSSEVVVLGNFNQIIADIEGQGFLLAQRDELISKVATSALLLLSKSEEKRFLLEFISQISLTRELSKNLFSDSFVDQLFKAVASFDLEALSTEEKIDLVINLDKIGIDFVAERAPNFLQNILQDFAKNSYKKIRFVKNAAHFLVHAKNIGLLDNLNEGNEALLRQLIVDLSNYIDDNAADLGLSVADAGAILDVFLYCNKVLHFEMQPHHLSILARASKDGEPIISGAQREIFNKIARFLTRGDGQEWSHVASREGGNRFVYGGVIAIELEGEILSEDGFVVKRADVVVRNLQTGEILRIIEVDGPSHFLTEKQKTSRTKARDRLEAAIVGERNLLVVNVDDFGFFKALGSASYDDVAEVEFLRKLKEEIDVQVSKIPPVLPSSAPALSDSREEAAAAQELPAEVVLPEVRKTAAQIKAELIADFVGALHRLNIGVVAELILDPRFQKISKEELSDAFAGKSPFDVVLLKFNELAKAAKDTAKCAEMLKILWIEGGFVLSDSALLDGEMDYPLDLRASLGLPAPATVDRMPVEINLSDLIFRARAGEFDFVLRGLRKKQLPPELPDSLERQVLMIMRFAAQGNNFAIFAELSKNVWFGDLKKELFENALKANDCAAINYFVVQIREEDFLVKFFKEKPHLASFAEKLSSKILSSALIKKAKIEDLVKQPEKVETRVIIRSLQGDPARILEAREEKTVQEYLALVDIYRAGICGTRSPKKAEGFCLEAIRKFPENNELKIALVKTYRDWGRPKHMDKAIKALNCEDSEVCFQLAEVFGKQERGIRYLDKAFELGHARATGVLATQYYYGIEGKKKDFGKAFELARKAVALGDVESLANLGTFYIHRSQAERAFHLFEQACEKGSAVGTMNLAICYDKSWGIDRNPARALNLYKKALTIGFDGEKEEEGQLSHIKEAIERLSKEVPPARQEGVARVLAAASSAQGSSASRE